MWSHHVFVFYLSASWTHQLVDRARCNHMNATIIQYLMRKLHSNQSIQICKMHKVQPMEWLNVNIIELNGKWITMREIKIRTAYLLEEYANCAGWLGSLCKIFEWTSTTFDWRRARAPETLVQRATAMDVPWRRTPNAKNQRLPFRWCSDLYCLLSPFFSFAKSMMDSSSKLCNAFPSTKHCWSTF